MDAVSARLVAGDPAQGTIACLVWAFEAPVTVVSSAPLGGGIGPRRWVVNAQVPADYERRDPDRHLRAVAGGLGLTGAGVGMLTAADVGRFRRGDDGGVRVEASVGVTLPVWAAAPDDDSGEDTRDDVATAEAGTGRPGRVGTVNVVALVPVRLSDAALVNAVATATEAKAQALLHGGIAGTGTASDALCIVCPAQGPAEAYGGTRSRWGARLARAVYEAVRSGCEPA